MRYIDWYVDKRHGEFLSLRLVLRLLLISLSISLSISLFISLSIYLYLSVYFFISPRHFSVFHLTSLVIWLLFFLSFVLSYSSLSYPLFLSFSSLFISLLGLEQIPALPKRTLSKMGLSVRIHRADQIISFIWSLSYILSSHLLHA